MKYDKWVHAVFELEPPASRISSELSSHQMARIEIVPGSDISSELSAHRMAPARSRRALELMDASGL